MIFEKAASEEDTDAPNLVIVKKDPTCPLLSSSLLTPSWVYMLRAGYFDTSFDRAARMEMWAAWDVNLTPLLIWRVLLQAYYQGVHKAVQTVPKRGILLQFATFSFHKYTTFHRACHPNDAL
jgi:hypothetical protein